MRTADADRRLSILQATVDVAATVGFRAMAVDDIAATAGIACRTFYRYFPSKQAAFEAGHDAICRDVRRVVRTALAPRADPYDRAAACLTGLTTFIASDPARAEVLLIEGPSAGPTTVEACTATMDDLAGVLTEITDGLPQLGGVPPVVAEVVVGGVHEILRTRTARGRLHELPSLVPDLVRILVTPYGPAARNGADLPRPLST